MTGSRGGGGAASSTLSNVAALDEELSRGGGEREPHYFRLRDRRWLDPASVRDDGSDIRSSVERVRLSCYANSCLSMALNIFRLYTYCI